MDMKFFLSEGNWIFYLPSAAPPRTCSHHHVGMCSVDSKNNTQCLCMWCKALLFLKGLHFHGNQTGRKERISAWNHLVLKNKAWCRPTASSEFSLWKPRTTLTLRCWRKASPPQASVHEKCISSSHWIYFKG